MRGKIRQTEVVGPGRVFGRYGRQTWSCRTWSRFRALWRQTEVCRTLERPRLTFFLLPGWRLV